MYLWKIPSVAKAHAVFLPKYSGTVCNGIEMDITVSACIPLATLVLA